MVLDCSTSVRGILDNDQGGPLEPPGLLMAAALNEVRESIQRNLDAKKGGSQKASRPCGRLHRPGSGECQAEQETIREFVEDAGGVTYLEGRVEQRKEKFKELIDDSSGMRIRFTSTWPRSVISFLAGLFVGGKDPGDQGQSRS